MPSGWRRPLEEPCAGGSTSDLHTITGDAESSSTRYQHQYPHSHHHLHLRVQQQQQQQQFSSGQRSDVNAGITAAPAQFSGAPPPFSAAPPPFSAVHQLSSSSAATPSPSSSSSSTPSSARLASRGLRSHGSRVASFGHPCRGLALTSSLGPGRPGQRQGAEGLRGGRGSTSAWGALDVEPEAGVTDCCCLSSVTEEAIVHNLVVRYESDIIYTKLAGDLISVNPYQRLDLYTPHHIAAYRTPMLADLPPHLFGIGERARRGVYELQEDQVVLMCGESGSGKTEAARLLLNFLTPPHVTPARNCKLRAGDRVLQAFGNARTRHNDNASRFAKHVELELDHRGEAVGGTFTCYLLEKGRVTRRHASERGFHFCYQLVTGAPPPVLKSLRLQRSSEQYTMLTTARPAASEADVDKHEYAETKHALDVLGLDDAEQLAVFSVVAAVLKLGNVGFTAVNNIDGTEGCALHNEYEAREACELLQCSPRQLLQALRLRSSAGSEEETVSMELTACQAIAARNLLCQALYARLFSWLVTRINQSLKVGEPSRRKVLSIVDVFGFEILERNSFSQLVINYSNERLTQVVRQATLQERQEEYVREGLDWITLDSPVGMPALQLLQQSKSGVLALIEELTLRPAPDPDSCLHKRPSQQACQTQGDASSSYEEEDLLKLLAKTYAGHPCVDVKPGTSSATSSRHQHPDNNLPVDAFRIRHFAGSVTYSVKGFLAQNLDELSKDLSHAMHCSHHLFLSSLFPEGNPRRAPHKRPASVVAQAQISLASLVRHVAGKKISVVHCLKPNDSKLPAQLDQELLAHQVRYHCLLESCSVSREGWIQGWTHQQFLQRYGLLSPHTWPHWRGSSLEGSALLLADLCLTPSQYTFGRTRVYVKTHSTLDELEQARRARVEALAVAIQATWRRHVQRRRFCRLRRAQAIIAGAWRRHRGQALVRNMQRFRREDWAATVIQNAYVTYLRFRREDWAATVIQNAYVTYLRWRFLEQLLTTPPSESPIAEDWPTAPILIAPLSAALRRLHHLNRCAQYRLRFDQTARNRMREKVTASIIFRDRKASYNRSIGHPFMGDYVRLRQNAQWKKIAADTNDHYIVFADIVNKITRSAGKFVPILLAVSTNALLVVDQRSLHLKYRIPAADIARISLSPFMDDIAVVHVKPSSPTTDLTAPRPPDTSQGGCLFGSDVGKRKGDIVLQTGHVIEVVTKLFLVVQNATDSPPDIVIATEFETNFGESTVVFSFRTTGLADVAPGHIRIIRRQNRMEVHL
ncbi:unconventional myosin-Ia [Hyalella azteca]|uniref:Unconventional myosin-Ia n=1 Tax=Hyalella azteca TaxID=294128 RepID=A0A979FKA0_HYAAZ|nr:unconventional myosin-Ia [Hyalella azteca]